MRSRKCKSCKEAFTPVRPLQQVCSMDCAITLANAIKKRDLARDIAERKKRLKTRSKWLYDVQKTVNEYVRLRDDDDPCISCGRYHQGQYHAGHYRSVGACPELRFEELNIHKQCAPCNNHKSGNIIEYRLRLEKKIGKEKLDWLEGSHEPKKYTVDELIEIKDQYRLKIKQLKKERASHEG